MASFLNTITHKQVRLFPHEQDFIDNFVLKDRFPWYWQGSQTLDQASARDNSFDFYNGPYLSHILLRRTDDPTQHHTNRPADHYSPHFEKFAEIFHRFMADNGLPYKNIYRANLNLNWHNKGDHTKPHKDHTFPHYNFIMYLDDCDVGNTLVWPDDYSGVYHSPCKKNTAITFKELWHAHEYPAEGQRRVVFVVTYG